MKPILYGPDGKPILPKEENTSLDHRQSNTKTPKLEKAIKLAKHFPRIWKSTSSRVLAIATLLGGIVLYPRISISPQDLLDSTNPLSVAIKVENIGQFTVYDTTMKCDIDFRNTTRHTIGKNLGGQDALDLPIGDLASGGYTTTSCPSFLFLTEAGDQVSAHMRVTLFFRPRFWPWKIHRVFFLRGNKESGNTMHWIRVSRF